MISLYDHYRNLLHRGWQPVFRQTRTLSRAVEHALALPCVLGRRTISRVICALGRQFQDWTADYRLFSRRFWQAPELFNPVLEDFLLRFPLGPIPLALDDTPLRKTGSKVESARWQYDHMSPPFHVNLLYGLRFLAASVLFPHHQQGSFSARAFPVRFQEAPILKKPGKRASAEQHRLYRQQRRQINLSGQAVELLRELRETLDRVGAASRTLLVAVDGAFCNRVIFRALLPGIHFIARCRKDARLCFPAPAGSRRRYQVDRFTPEHVRQDPSIPWRWVSVFYGAKRRRIRYKQIGPVLWQRGAQQRPLTLIVIAAQPYRLSKNARLNYRQPAYLLSTDGDGSPSLLIQTYLDRWQIEVNHRDLKQISGVGQAQVWAPPSVPRHPAFVAATYSLLQLAALQCFGPGRSEHFLPLPRWRKDATRASFLDMVSLLRQEILETPNSPPPQLPIRQNAVTYAFT